MLLLYQIYAWDAKTFSYHTDIKKKYNKRKHESQTHPIKIAVNLWLMHTLLESNMLNESSNKCPWFLTEPRQPYSQ